jgi:hypothetical protein
MSPRQQADRLFDRIMTANEQGNQAEVEFFLPMATQAYAMLGPLDVDARYHLGMIHALAGDLEALEAQRDSIRASVPDHLFATLLDAERARLLSDTADLRRAYSRFLETVDQELQSAKPEYADHRPALDDFRQAAAGGSN